jgi:biotin operon repressor
MSAPYWRFRSGSVLNFDETEVGVTETSSQLLELLWLLQAHRDWSGAELADRLAVSGRTIRRDVERLRDLGYPVESLTGPAGGYGSPRQPRARRRARGSLLTTRSYESSIMLRMASSGTEPSMITVFQ